MFNRACTISLFQHKREDMMEGNQQRIDSAKYTDRVNNDSQIYCHLKLRT